MDSANDYFVRKSKVKGDIFQPIISVRPLGTRTREFEESNDGVPERSSILWKDWSDFIFSDIDMMFEELWKLDTFRVSEQGFTTVLEMLLPSNI